MNLRLGSALATLIALAPLGPRPAAALDLEQVQLDLGTRYDLLYQPDRERNRLQGYLRLRFAIDTLLGIKLNGFASTGNTFTSKYGTYVDFLDASPEFNIYFRQLYLERSFDFMRIQLGAIPPIKNVVSRSGLFSKGWIDGGRIEVLFGRWGVLELVAGSLTDLDNPNLFSRDHRFNYLEAEASLDLLSWLHAELSLERVAEDLYTRAEARVTLRLPGDRTVTAVIEGVINADRRSFQVGGAVELDVLHWLTGTYRDRYVLQLMQDYVDPDIGLRGELTEDFYKYGHLTTVIVSGQIHREPEISWFVEGILADSPRLKAGLAFGFTR